MKVTKKFSIIIYFVLSLVITLSVRQNLFSNSTSSIIQIENYLISKNNFYCKLVFIGEKNLKQQQNNQPQILNSKKFM